MSELENIAHVKEGQSVDVLVYDSAKRDSIWTPGFTVTGIVTALDCDYRLNVKGPRTYNDIHPECVRVSA